MDKKITELKDYMNNSSYTVAVTGAGISYMYGMRRFKQLAGQGDWAKKLTRDYIDRHPDGDICQSGRVMKDERMLIPE